MLSISIVIILSLSSGEIRTQLWKNIILYFRLLPLFFFLFLLIFSPQIVPPFPSISFPLSSSISLLFDHACIIHLAIRRLNSLSSYIFKTCHASNENSDSCKLHATANSHGLILSLKKTLITSFSLCWKKFTITWYHNHVYDASRRNPSSTFFFFYLLSLNAWTSWDISLFY